MTLYRDVVRRLLKVTQGYECQEADGNFMLAFHQPVKALQFCLLVCTAMSCSALLTGVDVLHGLPCLLACTQPLCSAMIADLHCVVMPCNGYWYVPFYPALYRWLACSICLSHSLMLGDLPPTCDGPAILAAVGPLILLCTACSVRFAMLAAIHPSFLLCIAGVLCCVCAVLCCVCALHCTGVHCLMMALQRFLCFWLL